MFWIPLGPKNNSFYFFAVFFRGRLANTKNKCIRTAFRAHKALAAPRLICPLAVLRRFNHTTHRKFFVQAGESKKNEKRKNLSFLILVKKNLPRSDYLRGKNKYFFYLEFITLFSAP
jgi:hypothetical protein